MDGGFGWQLEHWRVNIRQQKIMCCHLFLPAFCRHPRITFSDWPALIAGKLQGSHMICVQLILCDKCFRIFFILGSLFYIFGCTHHTRLHPCFVDKNLVLGISPCTLICIGSRCYLCLVPRLINQSIDYSSNVFCFIKLLE